MYRRTALVFGLLVAASLPRVLADPPDESQPEGTSSEVQKFQGTWKVVGRVRDGEQVEPDQFDDMRLIFSETEYTFKNQQGKRSQGTYKLQPGRKPAVMEMVYADGPAEGKTALRIYQWVDKDTFKLCAPGPDERLPDNFEAPQGSGDRDVIVWKRIDD